MSDDNWSLKGKKEYVSIYDFMEKYHDYSIGVYEADYIETLRQKLIEDIEDIISEGLAHSTYLFYSEKYAKPIIEKAVKQINCRFGVNEK